MAALPPYALWNHRFLRKNALNIVPALPKDYYVALAKQPEPELTPEGVYKVGLYPNRRF